MSFEPVYAKAAEKSAKTIGGSFLRANSDQAKHETFKDEGPFSSEHRPDHYFGDAHIHADRVRNENFSAGFTQTPCHLTTTPRSYTFGGACKNYPPRVQAKLTINKPGDELEQEADKVANVALNMKDEELTGVPLQTSRLLPTLAPSRVQSYTGDESEEPEEADQVQMKQESSKSPSTSLQVDLLLVPLWTEIPAYAIADLKSKGVDKDWFDAQTEPVRLTILNLYVKLRGMGLWHYLNAIHREEIKSSIGCLHFDANVPGLKDFLRKNWNFRDPEKSDESWDSAEKRTSAALHFKHFKGWPTSKVQAHIDQVGIWLSSQSFWWVGVFRLPLHLAAYDSYKDVFGIRNLLLQQGWDSQTLQGIGKAKSIIQRKTIPNARADLSANAHLSSFCSGGQPLPRSLLCFFAPRLGYDFSQVRVHANSEASEASKNLNAKAFTLGRNIVFGSGQYHPTDSASIRLIAHELVHVVQQGSVGNTYNNPVQRKILMKRPRRYLVLGSWREMSQKERRNFVMKYFRRNRLVKKIVDGMGLSEDNFYFDDENELRTEVTKRQKTSMLMTGSQFTPGENKAFGYPDVGWRNSPHLLGPRVNAESKKNKYWEDVQFDSESSYYFKLSSNGKNNAYEAIRTLFHPQAKKKNRTLIHCDYLASVVHFRAFAETLGIKEFNDRVKGDSITVVLKWNGFQELMPKTFQFLRSAKHLSLQEVVPKNEKSLVIGDHVIFWNHRAYDKINYGIGEAWRLENAILVDKNGENIYEGHGSGRHSNKGMLQELGKRFNRVVKRNKDLTKKTTSPNASERATALSTLNQRKIEWVSAKWIIDRAGVNVELKEVDPNNVEKEPNMVGLKDPNDLSKMYRVKRPIESK